MSTLTVQRQREDKTARERTGHPQSYAEAKQNDVVNSSNPWLPLEVSLRDSSFSYRLTTTKTYHDPDLRQPILTQARLSMTQTNHNPDLPRPRLTTQAVHDPDLPRPSFPSAWGGSVPWIFCVCSGRQGFLSPHRSDTPWRRQMLTQNNRHSITAK